MKKSLIVLPLFMFFLFSCNDKPEVQPFDDALFLNVYPNPFRNFVYVTASQGNQLTILQVLDTKGNSILNEVVSQSEQTFDLDLQGEPSGTYYVVVQAGENKTVRKAIKL